MQPIPGHHTSIWLPTLRRVRDTSSTVPRHMTAWPCPVAGLCLYVCVSVSFVAGGPERRGALPMQQSRGVAAAVCVCVCLCVCVCVCAHARVLSRGLGAAVAVYSARLRVLRKCARRITLRWWGVDAAAPVRSRLTHRGCCVGLSCRWHQLERVCARRLWRMRATWRESMCDPAGERVRHVGAAAGARDHLCRPLV
jgi:hypothetical protein